MTDQPQQYTNQAGCDPSASSDATEMVTVVVPTWNRADHLRGLLDDLEQLVLRDERVEVIIVDDGSTDATPMVLQTATWATIVQQPNGGAAAARNAGWQRATSPVVVFIDDDCRPGDGWPHALLEAFQNAEVAGVGGRIVPTGHRPLDAFVTVERLVDHGRDLTEGVDYLVTANAAYRTSVLHSVGGFDEAFPGAAGEDVDLSWRVRAQGCRLERSDATVCHDHRSTVREVLRTYRAHGRSRALLDARFPDRPAAAAVGRALGLHAWIQRYRSYRSAGVGPIPSVALLALRVAGLASYAAGLLVGRRTAGLLSG